MIALVNAVLQLWLIEADWAVTAMGQTSYIKGMYKWIYIELHTFGATVA